MKNLENPIYMVITPQIDAVNDSLSFKWGIMNTPQILSNSDDGQMVMFPKSSNIDVTSIQLMRLFTTIITRGLIENTGKIDQNVAHEINFQIPQDMGKFVGDVLKHMGEKIVEEIKYQNDPVKPTKNKLESISLLK